MCGSDLQGQAGGVGGQRADGGVGARGGGRVCRGGGGHGGGGVGGVGGGAVSRHAHCAVLAAAAAHPPTVCDGLTARRVLAPPRPAHPRGDNRYTAPAGARGALTWTNRIGNLSNINVEL